MRNLKQLSGFLLSAFLVPVTSFLSSPVAAQSVASSASEVTLTALAHRAPQERTAGGSGTATNGVVEVVPKIFTLGDIEPGSEHARTFLLKNISRQPVQVQRSVTSCKCTTTSKIDGSTIPPGGTLEFEAVLAAPRTPGVKNAKVQIILEGGHRPLTMELEGDVTMAVKAMPAYIGGPRGEKNTGVVQLQALDGKPFSIISAGGEKPRYVGFNPKSDAPQSRYTLQWDVSKINDLSRHVWWVVYTDNPKCPVLPLRIRNELTGSKADMGRFQRYWMFDENIVNAEQLAAGVGVDLDVVIKHYNPRGRNQVVRPEWRAVKSIRSLSPDVTVQLLSTKVVSKDETRVLFRVTPRRDFSGPLYGLVALETETGVGEFAVLAFVKNGQG